MHSNNSSLITGHFFSNYTSPVLWRMESHCILWLSERRTRSSCTKLRQDDVIKWKHFPRYWPFVQVIHRSPVNSPHKGQWREASMFSMICVWINGWVNNREAGDLRRHRAHNDVTAMEAATVGITLSLCRCAWHSLSKVLILKQQLIKQYYTWSYGKYWYFKMGHKC